MRAKRKVKIIEKKSGEEYIYNTPLEAANAIGYSYMAIMNWISGRQKNKFYEASYIECN